MGVILYVRESWIVLYDYFCCEFYKLWSERFKIKNHETCEFAKISEQ